MVGPRNIEEFLCISFQFQRIIIFLILYNKFLNSISIRNFNISFIGELRSEIAFCWWKLIWESCEFRFRLFLFDSKVKSSNSRVGKGKTRLTRNFALAMQIIVPRINLARHRGNYA